jgi:hypothetical protein
VPGQPKFQRGWGWQQQCARIHRLGQPIAKPNEAKKMSTEERNRTSHFIRNIIAADIESLKHRTVVTRFRLNNGHLHIGRQVDLSEFWAGA